MEIKGHEFEDMHYLSEVVRGAELLDKIMPNWADLIDIRGFDMANDDWELLSILFGSYDEGIAAVHDHMSRFLNPAHYGFHVYKGQEGDHVAWEQLTEAWKRIIPEFQHRWQVYECQPGETDTDTNGSSVVYDNLFQVFDDLKDLKEDYRELRIQRLPKWQ